MFFSTIKNSPCLRNSAQKEFLEIFSGFVTVEKRALCS